MMRVGCDRWIVVGAWRATKPRSRGVAMAVEAASRSSLLAMTFDPLLQESAPNGAASLICFLRVQMRTGLSRPRKLCSPRSSSRPIRSAAISGDEAWIA